MRYCSSVVYVDMRLGHFCALVLDTPSRAADKSTEQIIIRLINTLTDRRVSQTFYGTGVPPILSMFLIYTTNNNKLILFAFMNHDKTKLGHKRTVIHL